MIKKLKNLWELSDYHPVQKEGETKLETDAKPKGMAKIVNMEDPIDLFPEQTQL